MPGLCRSDSEVLTRQRPTIADRACWRRVHRFNSGGRLPSARVCDGNGGSAEV